MLEEGLLKIYGYSGISKGYTGGLLIDAFDITRKLTPKLVAGEMPTVALGKAGFTETGQLKTKSGIWVLYERPDYTLPMSPEGEVTVYAMAAAYVKAGDNGEQTAGLKVSANQFGKEKFLNDLETLTRHFTERQMVFGFPSKAMTHPAGYFALAFTGLVAETFLGNYLSSGGLNPIISLLSQDYDPASSAELGALAGGVYRPAAT